MGWIIWYSFLLYVVGRVERVAWVLYKCFDCEGWSGMRYRYGGGHGRCGRKGRMALGIVFGWVEEGDEGWGRVWDGLIHN